MMSNLLRSKLNLILGALCVSVLVTGCGDRSASKPAPETPAQPAGEKPVTPAPSKPGESDPAKKQEPSQADDQTKKGQTEKPEENSQQPQQQAQPPKAENEKADQPVAEKAQTAPSEKPSEKSEPPVVQKSEPALAPVPTEEAPKPNTEVAQPEKSEPPAPQKVEPAPVQPAPATEASQQPELPVVLPNEQLAAKVKAVGEKLGFEIRVGGKLSTQETEQGLARLEQSMDAVNSASREKGLEPNKPARLVPLFDYVELSKTHKAIHEHDEAVRVQFDVSQQPRESYWILKTGFARCEPEGSEKQSESDELSSCRPDSRTVDAQKFRAARAELDEVRKQLPGVEILCGTKKELSVVKCAMGAQSYLTASKMLKPSRKEQIKTVVVSDWHLLTAMFPVGFSQRKDAGLQMSVIYSTTPPDIRQNINYYWVGLD